LLKKQERSANRHAASPAAQFGAHRQPALDGGFMVARTATYIRYVYPVRGAISSIVDSDACCPSALATTENWKPPGSHARTDRGESRDRGF
jgi:hypothetical protein